MNSESKPLKTIRLFRTAPHGCSYLLSEEATTLFVDPDVEVSQRLNTRLSDKGFRRSGTHIYKPDCLSCNACVSCRILVDQFAFKRRHNKLSNRNADLQAYEEENLDCPEAYSLYCKYINDRHADGDMFPPNKEQYNSFIANKVDGTRFFMFRREGQLLAVSIVDQLEDAWSAVYTFFDSSQPKRSLGNYVILWQIRKARQLGLPYLYLGYWVKGCQKMSYKSNFRPMEMFLNNKWLRLN